jgi:tRNA threonylcarbamoyladenosine biosynthesis protein TsaB
VITLALETSTPHGSVAVHDGAALLFSEGFVSERGHSSLLFPLLQAALASVPRVEQIAVGLGPGSYAGVRIAIATGMGLALTLGVPLVGIPSVAALTGESKYVAIGDARRETWYWTKVAGGICLEGPLLLEDAEFRERLAATDWPILSTELLPEVRSAGVPPRVAVGETPTLRTRVATPSAETIAAFGAQGRGIVATGALEPIYLREPHITKPKPR